MSDAMPLAQRLHAWLEGRGRCLFSPEGLCVHTSRARNLAALIDADYIQPARADVLAEVGRAVRELLAADPHYTPRTDALDDVLGLLDVLDGGAA